MLMQNGMSEPSEIEIDRSRCLIVICCYKTTTARVDQVAKATMETKAFKTVQKIGWVLRGRDSSRMPGDAAHRQNRLLAMLTLSGLRAERERFPNRNVSRRFKMSNCFLLLEWRGCCLTSRRRVISSSGFFSLLSYTTRAYHHIAFMQMLSYNEAGLRPFVRCITESSVAVVESK